MNFPFAFDRTSLFQILGVSGGIFLFIQILMDNTVIRRHILPHLIWVCPVCQCPQKRMLGLRVYGLNFVVVVDALIEQEETRRNQSMLVISCEESAGR